MGEAEMYPTFAQMVEDVASDMSDVYDRDSFVAGARAARVFFDIGVALPGVESVPRPGATDAG